MVENEDILNNAKNAKSAKRFGAYCRTSVVKSVPVRQA